MKSELPANPEEFQMGLFDHLRELRKRLFISAVAVVVGAIFSYMMCEELFALLCHPYYVAFKNAPLIGTGPSDAFVLKMKVSVVAGAVLMSPLLFYQLWLFVAPGLYHQERKVVIPFIVCSTVLFSIGVWFCYSQVLPLSFEFFRDQYDSINLTPTIKIGEHLSMTMTALLGFGAVFEMPLLTYFLARAGLVDDRTLITYFRHATLVIFVVSAVLTPPDVLTQFLMAGPLMVLYGISILVARLAKAKQENPEQNESV